MLLNRRHARDRAFSVNGVALDKLSTSYTKSILNFKRCSHRKMLYFDKYQQRHSKIKMAGRPMLKLLIN